MVLSTKQPVLKGEFKRKFCNPPKDKQRYFQYVVLSNACHYIGQLLNKVYYEDSDPRKAAILAVLQTLSRNYARDVGRQLAAGLSADDASPRNCTKDFLALLLRDPTNSLSETEERWVALILSMTLCSFELREIFGEDAIREAVSIEDAFKNANLCKFLSFFSYDAWGRAKLRESGALTIILQRLDETRELDERDVIVSSLRHFIHDTIGMGFLLKHSIFPTIALKHLREYLKNRSYTCTPELKAEDDLSDALACVTSAVTVSLEENPSSSSERLRKEYTTEPRSPSCNWSPSMSSYSNSLSPSPSSTSDDLYSLNWAGGFDNDDASSRPSVGDRFTLSHLSFNEEPTSKKLNKEEQAIAGEMFILSWLSHEEVNHKYLINQEIVSALVGYISRAPTLDLKAARSLKRLARSRACIHQLLEIRFQTIVVHYLLRQPCTLVRNAKTCDRCDKRMEYGREVLREFSTHIDSEFGWSYLSQSLKSSNKQKRLSSYLAGLILLRSGHHRKRFMQFFHPLDELWEYLSAVLKDKNAFEEDRLAMEPPLSCQLLVALSILVTSFPSLSEENDILEVLPKFLVSEDKCFVESQDDSVPTLKFRSKQGALLATVPKDRVCSASEYFRGMFGSEFLESIENRQEFVFDPTSEGCDESDFTNFLHFLSGCRQKRCFSVTSAKRCVSLLYLADRYLCSELSKFLLHPKIGSVKTLLNGDNLQEFLPVCLSISRIDQQLGKMCMRTMLQFSSDAQLTKTLETLVGDSRGTELFVRFLKDFLNRYERAWSS
ncbi:hypothetical protein QR680_009572 [Steinernema hermaphroditum]|uniref:BTB domain-containing protein n=1 Tax=Steinernema hermaphroditum TaxID=289476 RepID=A0AA39INB0_9BILA|nr:hypothetical protein QR680_009572 [Steinernema hermaphroditum]